MYIKSYIFPHVYFSPQEPVHMKYPPHIVYNSLLKPPQINYPRAPDGAVCPPVKIIISL